MKDVFKKQAEALDFAKDGKAYIHGELTDGELDLLMSGNIKAVTWMLTRIIEQLADKTGAEVSELLGLINALHLVRDESSEI